jgi:predicted RNA-binding Zn-ribbon protein involved in translation (DUF1610 family)
MKANVVCDGCGEVVQINANDINEKDVVVVEDKANLKLTLFVCPECGEIHVVQIDDGNTLVLLNNCRKEIRKGFKKKMNNKKNNGSKFNRYNSDLTEMREQLNILYNGKHYYDKNEIKEIKFRDVI